MSVEAQKNKTKQKTAKFCKMPDTLSHISMIKVFLKICLIVNVNIRIVVCKCKYPNVNIKRFARQMHQTSVLNAPISSLGESETLTLPSVFISCS